MGPSVPPGDGGKWAWAEAPEKAEEEEVMLPGNHYLQILIFFLSLRVTFGSTLRNNPWQLRGPYGVVGIEPKAGKHKASILAPILLLQVLRSNFLIVGWKKVLSTPDGQAGQRDWAQGHAWYRSADGVGPGSAATSQVGN